MNGTVRALTLTLALATPGAAAAQTIDLDASLLRSDASVGALDGSAGLRLAVTADRLFGPVGARLSLERAGEGSVDPDGFCTWFGECIPGPLDVDAALTTVRLSLLVGSPADAPVRAVLGLSGARTSFGQDTRRADTREVVDWGGSTAVGLGASLDVRFPRLVGPVGPVVHAQVDRLGSRACPADAACYFGQGRTISSVGVGLSWRLR
jgi:hypothetical protein